MNEVDYRFYPNPANDFFIIELNHELHKRNVEFSDSLLLGQIINQQGSTEYLVT